MSSSEEISTSELSDKWNSESQPGFGWACYRFPGAAEINFTGGKVFMSSNDKIAVDGFIIAPFYHPEKMLWHIERSLHFQLIDNGSPNPGINIPFYYLGSEMKSNATQTEYEKFVGEIIEEIKKGVLQKAVPARSKKINLTAGFSPFSLYKSLLAAYPNAFVYILSTPQTGTWVGCTPEKLLHFDNKEINTVSLAGTMKTNGAGNEGFNPKELEEQDIVTNYIRNVLKKYCSKISMDGPHIIRAGNVSHLATYIKGILIPGFEGEYMQILKDLHPTPAVCGMPRRASRVFLLQYENFDRALYSGFLGPAEKSQADIFVNLRCMQVFENSALLYAGAGVVKGSIPENEWFETEEKMNTLLRFL